MESPSRSLTLSPTTLLLSPESTITRRRISSDSANSPEFEFWKLGRDESNKANNTLLSADELFSDGFLLPLHFLPNHHHHYQDLDPEPEPEPDPEPSPSKSLDEPVPEPEPSASITSSAGSSLLTASKRWKEIFRRGEKKTAATDSTVCSCSNSSSNNKLPSQKEKTTSSIKRREKKHSNSNCNGNSGGGGSSNNAAELNINIWPFSRSRSAGNNSSGRSRPAVSTNRKVSSAPCSRSNSSGDSKSRRAWPSSPGRAGVHLGRTSPVWQLRRNRTGSDENRRTKGGSGKARVLNLNVPMCIGYRQQLSCRSDENGPIAGGNSGSGGRNSGSDGGSSGSVGGGGGGSNGNLFGLRGLFSKKSVLTV